MPAPTPRVMALDAALNPPTGTQIVCPARTCVEAVAPVVTGDAGADEVGGCSDGPTVIDLVARIYWTC